jgi:hypothetical protein
MYAEDTVMPVAGLSELQVGPEVTE